MRISGWVRFSAIVVAICLVANVLISETRAQNLSAQFLEEFVFCEGAAATWDEMPRPAKRQLLGSPGVRHIKTDWDVLVRLTVDDHGQVVSIQRLLQSPDDIDLDGLIAGLKNWSFAANRPGTFCLNIAHRNDSKRKRPIPPTEDDTVARAPAPLETEPAPVFAADAVAANLSCRVTVDVFLGPGGVPLGAMAAAEEPAGWSCGNRAAYAVRQWRFPPDTTPVRYRLKLKVQA